MFEELENQVNPEISTSAVETDPVKPAEEQEKKDRDYNFRMMRERALRAEERAAAMERERYAQSQPQVKDEDDIPDDDFATGRHIKKYAKSQKELQEKLEETRRAQEKLDASIAEMHVRTKNQDYDKIVNDENLEKLYKANPSMIESLKQIKDVKTQMQLAYDAINMYVQPTKTATQEKRLEENRMKPKSVASLNPQSSESPLARADDYDRRTLTDQRKKELYKEMMDAAARAH